MAQQLDTAASPQSTVRFLQLTDGTLVPYSIPLQWSQPLAFPTLNNVVIDSASVAPVGRGVKTAILVVTTALTWVTSAQAKIQAYSGIQTQAAVAGATSQLTASISSLVGAQANLGATGTTLPVGIYVFSPQSLPELQWYHPFMGFELVFPSALTAGVAQLLLFSSSH